MRYVVELERITYEARVVEADDEDDAIDKARLGEGEVQSTDSGPLVVWGAWQEGAKRGA